MADSTSIPIIVQGNSFSLAIPLQIYVIEDGEMVLQDYYPDPTDEVSIQLKGDRRQYTYTPTITDNFANIDLSGNELADNYAVVVSIVKASGQRLRSFRTDQFFIVESSDDLTMDDIIAGLEENVIYLNAQAFISLGEVVISDSTTTFDANSALSAKQGAILRENIELILSSLGEYAFPTGKPTLDWSGGTLAVTLNLTDFSSSNMSDTAQRGGTYTTTLTPTHSSNLYVNDVVIMMGDEDITATAYNESTGVVSIAEVTGAIEITASQETYVQDGLVFNLDGLNRGGNAGHWVDLVGNIDFTLTNVTENDDNVVFGNTSSATSSGTLDVDALTSTVECGYIIADNIAPNAYFSILRNTTDDKVALGFMNSTANGLLVSSLARNTTPSTSIRTPELPLTSYKKGYLSIKIIQSTGVITPEQGGYFNGERVLEGDTYITLGTRASLMLMYNGTDAQQGTLFYLRVYDRRLTDAEILQNYKVDKKRFNII